MGRGALIILAILLVVGLVVGYVVVKPQTQAVSSPPPAQSTPKAIALSQTPPPSASAADAEPHEVPPTEPIKQAPQTAVVQAATRPNTAAVAPAQLPEPTPYTRQLVSTLTNLNLTAGPVTKEQADQWKLSLQNLTQQGAAAVPAIREFLEQNRDLNFAAVAGGDLFGQSSLRSALINALQQIGGPEASAALVQTMQTTAVPSELALIAQALEQQAPGRYTQETIGAIREVLGMASKGQLAEWDVGPLFRLLQGLNDPAAVAALGDLQSQWRYYATMSLAGLPEGTGVSRLLQEIQDPNSSSRRDFAFQMLAQSAGQYPDASAAILEQARLNQISDSAWSKIATGLAGDQYQIGTPPSTVMSGLKTYHIQSGNQNFYSLPVAPDAQINERLTLINQLLSIATSPAAVSALQNARDTLTRKVAGK